MIREFEDRPVQADQLSEILDNARRAPSAGNTQACEFLVLEGPEDVARYWSTTLPTPRQATFRWQGLLHAPVLVVITTSPSAYVERYAEGDKSHTSLGSSQEAWAQPFWWFDAGAVAQNMLLLAVDEGLGACLFGVFDHEAAIKSAFGIPDDRRVVCTIAIGHPKDGGEPGRSAMRRRPKLESITHRGRWSPAADHQER